MLSCYFNMKLLFLQLKLTVQTLKLIQLFIIGSACILYGEYVVIFHILVVCFTNFWVHFTTQGGGKCVSPSHHAPPAPPPQRVGVVKLEAENGGGEPASPLVTAYVDSTTPRQMEDTSLPSKIY